MRWIALGISLALVAASGATPNGDVLAESRLEKLFVPADRRRVSTLDGIRLRDVDGGFIPVTPVINKIPAKSGEESTRKRRWLRKDEVVVPKSLLNPPSKRAPRCDSGYSLCPDDGCCPTGGDCCSGDTCCKKDNRCCSGGGCCPTTHYCDVVDGQAGCCRNGKTCTADGDDCATSGYVPCTNYDYCCPSGQDCYRNTLGEVRCAVLDSDTTVTDNPAGGGSPTALAFPKTTSTSTSTSTMTSPASTSSSVSTPSVGASLNGATAVTFGRGGYALLITAVLFAFGPVVDGL